LGGSQCILLSLVSVSFIDPLLFCEVVHCYLIVKVSCLLEYHWNLENMLTVDVLVPYSDVVFYKGMEDGGVSSDSCDRFLLAPLLGGSNLIFFGVGPCSWFSPFLFLSLRLVLVVSPSSRNS